LIALINESIGKPAGFINPLLYKSASTAADFNDISSGDNGSYSAGPGWDACSGLGSPIGIQVAAALGAPPPAQAKKTGT
jgi:kumamolisin